MKAPEQVQTFQEIRLSNATLTIDKNYEQGAVGGAPTGTPSPPFPGSPRSLPNFHTQLGQSPADHERMGPKARV